MMNVYLSTVHMTQPAMSQQTQLVHTPVHATIKPTMSSITPRKCVKWQEKRSSGRMKMVPQINNLKQSTFHYICKAIIILYCQTIRKSAIAAVIHLLFVPTNLVISPAHVWRATQEMEPFAVDPSSQH